MKFILTRKAQALQSLDKSYKVDIAVICGMQGAAGESRLALASLDCLPNECKPMTVPQSSAKLTHLISSSLYNFCGTGGQNKVNMLRGFVANIHKDTRPNMGHDHGSDFTKPCAIRLAFFAIIEVAKDGGQEVLFGLAAVAAMFEQVGMKVEGDSPYDLHTLQTIGKFHWLLTTAQTDKLKEWTKKLLGGGFALATSGAEDKSDKDKKNDDKKLKNKAEATNLVNSFF